MENELYKELECEELVKYDGGWIVTACAIISACCAVGGLSFAIGTAYGGWLTRHGYS